MHIPGFLMLQIGALLFVGTLVEVALKGYHKDPQRNEPFWVCPILRHIQMDMSAETACNMFCT